MHSRWMVIRVLAGAWCLGCFFLIQIYCCTLTSHLTMPYRKVLINSVYDIPNVTGQQITVDRGLAPELLIKVNIDTIICLFFLDFLTSFNTCNEYIENIWNWLNVNINFLNKISLFFFNKKNLSFHRKSLNLCHLNGHHHQFLYRKTLKLIFKI